MKKFLALAMAAVLLVCSFASCAANLGDTSAIDEYVPEKDYWVDEKGNTFTFEEAEGETAILVGYNGKATRDDKVVIPAMFGDRTVTTIGDDAFYNLAAVVEVTIPDTVTTIGKHAFAGCSELTVVNLPAGTVTIGEAAFARCTKLTTLNDADHPLEALEIIGDKAFWECTALTTINGGKLPATLKEIGSAAFWGCTGLTSVEIPESVEKIGDLAYYNCEGLEEIVLHDGLKAENLGKFIFTTRTSTLKDKIRLDNLTEGSDAWNYVQSIAEPADDETAAPVDPSETEEPGDDETEAPDKETTPVETKPAETEPQPSVVQLSFDELRKNGDSAQGVFAPGAAKDWNNTVTVEKTVLSLDFWGWVGVKGEIGQFGYQIGNNPIVYDDSFAFTTEQGVLDAAAGAGADTASRMLIKIDISKINGESTIKTYYLPKGAKASQAEVLSTFTVTRVAPTPAAPAGDVTPVKLLDAVALNVSGGNGVEQVIANDGFVTVIPNSDDPHYLVPAGFNGARYVSIKYYTVTADKCNTQIYLGSTGDNPKNDNTMLQQVLVGNGQWNLAIFDLDQLKEPLNSDYYVSYFRFDALQAGFQTDEDGNYIYINEEAGNIAKLPMPDGADIDVAYIAFFNSKADAYAYEYGKTEILTEKPAGFEGATEIEFEAQAEAIKDDTNIYVGENGTFKYVYLKAPEGLEKAKSIPVKFTVDADGTYDLLVTMMGWTGKPRTGYVQIDNGAIFYIRSEGNEVAADGTDPLYATMSVDLTAGEHTFTIFLADDFDNDAVKSLYFDKLSFTEQKATYVTEGLVSMYQGGSGDVWEDMVGSNDVTLTLDANNTLTENGLQVKTAQHYFPQAIVDLVNGQTFTVEILFGDFECLGSEFNTFMNSANDNFALFRRVSTDELEFKFAANPGDQRHKIPGAQALLPNSLITVTYTVGGDCVIYINGEVAATKPSPSVMGANDLYIGHAASNKDFNALFRCIRFYNVALTAEQVLSNAIVDGVAVPAAPEAPVEPAEMGKADIFELGVQDGKPADVSANAMPITVLGAPTINGEDHVFAGKPDNYKVPAFKDHYTNLQDGFTLEVYLTTGADVTTTQAPVANLHAGGFGIEITNGQAALLVRFGSSYLRVYAPVEVNTTYHMVAVYDNAAGELRMYVNGVLTDTQKVSGTMGLPSADGAMYLCIGADSEIDYGSTGENFFIGTIHDVRIYGVPATSGNALWLWQQISA